MSESERGIWADHPTLANDYTHDCDHIDLNAVEFDPDP